MLGAHLFGGLVFAQTFEGGLADHARAGPAGELDLGDEHRLDPIPVLLFAGRILAGERALVGGVRFELLEQVLGIARVEAGADLADMDQMIAAIDAGDAASAGWCRCRSSRRSRPHGRRGIWIWSRSPCGPSGKAR